MICNSCFEMDEEYKHWLTTLTDPNYIQEEIKSILRSGNVCYHSVQNILSSSFLFKSTKIKIYRTIILPAMSKKIYRYILIYFLRR